MSINVNTFESPEQYQEFLRIRRFFGELIILGKLGYMILDDKGVYMGAPYIDGVELGFEEDNCRTLFVGASYAQNSDTGEYSIPYVETPLTEIRKQVKVYQEITIDIGD